MLSTNPRFDAELVRIRPVGEYVYAILSCPRCRNGIGATGAMIAGMDSIVCEGRFPTGERCGGHYYWRNDRLEFVGTAPK